MENNLKDLNDNELANYLHSVNLKWIQAMQVVSLEKLGTHAFRNAHIRQKACETVYGRAVTEAVSRGMLIVH